MNIYPYRLCKMQIKKDCPSWEWLAERSGMGWIYIGIKNGNVVQVKPCAVMCGPAEDDYSTQWRVDDGKKTVDYYSWVMRIGRHEV